MEQEFFFEVEWQVDDVEKARKSWDSWSVIRKFKEEHQDMFCQEVG